MESSAGNEAGNEVGLEPDGRQHQDVIAEPIATQLQLLTKDEGRRTDRLAKERVRQMYLGSCMLPVSGPVTCNVCRVKQIPRLRFGKAWRHCRRLPAWQRFLLYLGFSLSRPRPVPALTLDFCLPSARYLLRFSGGASLGWPSCSLPILGGPS